uniref:glycosyl hydrolase n=1 Tax=Litorivivens sp. TaxID=2020868 RepID=UPI0035672303
MKRLSKILLGIVLAVIVFAAMGVALFIRAVNGNLTPPPNPEGQPSIASYATPFTKDAAPPNLQDEFSWKNILEPPKSARPWTRWWWPGGDVDANTAVMQLETLDKAGFGGVEIQPFLGGAMALAENDEVMARIYSFDSPAYYNTLHNVIEEAHARNIGVDLTHFSGWPPGGPEVNLEDSLTILAYGEATVRGGKQVDIALPKPKPGPSEYIFSMMEFAGADFINFPVEHAQPLSVVAARRIDGNHALTPFNLDDTVRLDEKTLTVLTPHIEGDRLRWDAPEGEWALIVSYLMPSGEVPMGAAQKPQGFVVDHLRTPQVIGHYEYAYGERTGLPAFYGKGLRGFFNDSLEFRLKRMAVDDILEEFKKRRGYDLELYLPAIYIEGADNVYFREILGVHAAPEFELSANDESIRHDYQQTLSDLVIERFIETSAQWAHERGLVSRGQSYGMDIDILRALGSNTIPETEQLWAGGANVGLKFASSAAALYGKPLVSAESFVWINRDYMPTARRIKAAADKMFLAGINHIIYHGTPYPWWGPQDSPFGNEGWQPFSSVGNPAHFSSHVNENNTALWPDMPDLNRYITRSQYLLRQGAPEIDVLIYYPFLGFHGPNPAKSTEALVGGALPDADPASVAVEDPMLTSGKQQLDRVMTVPRYKKDERVAWVESIQPLLRDLEQRGLSWGWVNAHALTSGKASSGVLKESGGHYQSLMLFNVDAITTPTVDALSVELEVGVPVFFVGDVPQRIAGFDPTGSRDSAVRESIRNLIANGAKRLADGGGEIVNAIQSQTVHSVRHQSTSTIQRYQRIFASGEEVHFFANQSADAARVSLSLNTEKFAWWFDALTGEYAPLSAEGETAELALQGFESRFLILGEKLPDVLANQPELADLSRSQFLMLDGWDFRSGDFSTHFETLADWRNFQELQYAASGIYTHNFALERVDPEKRYILDLGLVQGSAVVRVN